MITKTDKKRIIKALGHRYVTPIKEELKALNILNSKGEEYSSSMITNVMNGVCHEDVERAIYSAVEKKAKKIQERKELLKAI